jgi:hypothetical protein
MKLEAEVGLFHETHENQIKPWVLLQVREVAMGRF